MTARRTFVTGATGYLGRALLPALRDRGHEVRALVRPESKGRLTPGVEMVPGNALDHASFVEAVAPADTFVQLVGVSHPGPGKARQFLEIDLVSVRESVKAAQRAGIRHFVYVSVARPAPVMKAYQAVRAEGEEIIRASGLPATFLRPWYVLGPGHWWPYGMLPLYWAAELTPWTREGARRQGLVTLRQMTAALVEAVEHPPTGIRVVEVPEIKAGVNGAGGARS
ncbi:MAG TPA: NAD(P)H-binding protein [Methylomirabilota bacterium]|nr:NAD(P)H-binding protein [Methylomirabilota bacterium]